MRRGAATLCLAGGLLCGAVAGAQQPSEEQIRRWESLSPEQKAELRRRLEALKALPRGEQAELRRRLALLKKLSPEERRRSRRATARSSA